VKTRPGAPLPFKWATPTKAATSVEVRKRVRQARALLLRSGCKNADLEKVDIELYVRGAIVQRARWESFRTDQRKKEAADRVERAIHRLEIALKDPSLPSAFRGLGLQEPLGRLRAAAKELAVVKLQPRRDVGDKRAAVREAAALLQALGRPLKRSRTGEFCRLAVVLYGDKEVGFYDLCCAHGARLARELSLARLRPITTGAKRHDRAPTTHSSPTTSP
jgi:hypothetical protein